MYLEVIVETLDEALKAEKAGADRLELVSAISEGGLTPSKGLIDAVTSATTIPVQVMLRPHGKSFTYDAHDRTVILNDLEIIRNTGADGIVFGALDATDSLDEALLDEIILKKGRLKLTFHRAVDAADDYMATIQTLLKKDVDAILTAGGTENAYEGRSVLERLKPEFHNRNIELLAGKGLSLDNLEAFYADTGIDHIHVGSGAKTGASIDPEKIREIKRIGK